MAAGIQVEVIKRTQETLGTVIKKPPLNDKLLTKPPFRFLHDIITNVISTTSFMKGLYTPEEMVSENCKDKESKIAFLQKAIDVVSLVNNETLSVRPAKIVAGHEPEKTNEFLQALAKCILGKKDSSDAVKQVKGGKSTIGPPIKKESKSKDPTKLKDAVKTKDPAKPNNKVSSKTPKTVEKAKKSDVVKPSKQEASKKSIKKIETPEKVKIKPVLDAAPPQLPSPPQTEIINHKPPEKEVIPDIPNIPVAQISNGNIMRDSPIGKVPSPEAKISSPKMNTNSPIEIPKEAISSRIKEDERPSTSSVHRPITSKKQMTRSSGRQNLASAVLDDDGAKETKPSPILNSSPEKSIFDTATSRPQSAVSMRSARTVRTARPTTARPAPPRILNKNIVNVEEAIRAASAKQVASVILDDDKDEEDEGFVVDDKADEQESLGIISTAKFGTKEINEDEKQGSLVKQMLETKKDLEGGSQQMQENQVKTDFEKTLKKENETTSKDLEQLRQFIQTVSRSANPLGKMLDYLQEDIDAMNQELKMWHEEHQQNILALRREENVTESILEPLSRQLEDLDIAVQDQFDSISAIKASIIHNDERIQRMLQRAHNS